MIENMLDLSTAHMPSEKPDFGEHRVIEHEYGFIVFVNTEVQAPEWLEPLMELARTHGCILICFDRDAGRHDGLPSWDW